MEYKAGRTTEIKQKMYFILILSQLSSQLKVKSDPMDVSDNRRRRRGGGARAPSNSGKNIFRAIIMKNSGISGAKIM